jgi:hypothetical protein
LNSDCSVGFCIATSGSQFGSDVFGGGFGIFADGGLGVEVAGGGVAVDGVVV